LVETAGVANLYLAILTAPKCLDSPKKTAKRFGRRSQKPYYKGILTLLLWWRRQPQRWARPLCHG